MHQAAEVTALVSELTSECKRRRGRDPLDVLIQTNRSTSAAVPQESYSSNPCTISSPAAGIGWNLDLGDRSSR